MLYAIGVLLRQRRAVNRSHSSVHYPSTINNSNGSGRNPAEAPCAVAVT